MQVKILPSRQALVDRIELQYEYGQSIVTLLGGPGLGKSYILESFVTDKYPDFNKIYLQLNHKTSDQQVISQLLEQSFSQPLIDFSLSLSENYLQLNKQQASKNTVIVIDNAQFLSEELADEIAYLTQISETIFYVLTASTSKLNFKNSTNIYFESLSFDESTELMSMYFSQLPNKHEPVFKAFVESAQGNPALLLSWDPSSVEVDSKKSKHGFMLFCLAFVVLTTLSLSYLFESLSQKEQIESLRQLSVQNTGQESEVDELNIKSVQNTEQKNEVNKLNIKIVQNKEQENKVAKLDNESDLLIKVDVIKQSQTLQSIDSETDNYKKTVIDSSDLNMIAESLKTEKVEVLKNTKIEMKNQTEIDENETKPIQVFKPLNETILDTKEKLNDYDNTWFINQQESLVMLQLIGISQEHLINKFLFDHELNSIKIYKSTRYGGEWWVVTVGPFKDIVQSQTYKNSLSAELKQLQPFSKKIKVIKTEIALLKSI